MALVCVPGGLTGASPGVVARTTADGLVVSSVALPTPDSAERTDNEYELSRLVSRRLRGDERRDTGVLFQVEAGTSDGQRHTRQVCDPECRVGSPAREQFVSGLQ